MSLPRPTVRLRARAFLIIGTAVSLCACATQPITGPRIMAMPAAGENFETFQKHDATCRDYAANQSGQAASKSPGASRVGGAVVGAGMGAAAGALIGSASGHAGNGAAIGAGSGLLLGAVLGQGRQRRNAEAAQSQYDMAYAQCMAANGERVPARTPRAVTYLAPPVVYSLPPVVYEPYPAPPYAPPGVPSADRPPG
jgi:hypothetical protein